MNEINEYNIGQWTLSLKEEEKSELTIAKYLSDVRKFANYVRDTPLTKDIVISYKQLLMKNGYAPASINSMLAPVNNFVNFIGREDCRVKKLKLQKTIYCREELQLTLNDYHRLIEAAENEKVKLIMETICSTGIRVSELQYFTVEGINTGIINVCCKNKIRTIFIPDKLRMVLQDYAKRENITTGIIFKNKKGEPISRTVVWREMKSLAEVTGVGSEKIYPHALRKLFARSYYEKEKDVSKLADLLGHSSVDTTRIYIMSTGIEHKKSIEKLGLVI